MPKVALYVRYSSDLQNPQSIDDQLLLCRQLAEREGWEVVDIYFDETASGASIRGRAGLNHIPVIAAKSVVGKNTNSSTSRPSSQTIIARAAPIAALVASARNQYCRPACI